MKTMKLLLTAAFATIMLSGTAIFLTSCENVQAAKETSGIELPAVTNSEVLVVPAPAPAEVTSPPDGTLTSTRSALQGLHVERAALCEGIEGHEPVGISSEFGPDGRVYLYTKMVLPAGEQTTIQHVWKREGKTVSTVDLDISGPSYRTRSYKTMTTQSAGNWTVEVQTNTGEILDSIHFVVR